MLFHDVDQAAQNRLPGGENTGKIERHFPERVLLRAAWSAPKSTTFIRFAIFIPSTASHTVSAVGAGYEAIAVNCCLDDSLLKRTGTWSRLEFIMGNLSYSEK
ncbi:hypothetical protein ACOTD7_19360 [Achromobacter xylosoxidans]